MCDCNNKKRGNCGLALDVIMTICTGGIWLIWMLIRFLRNYGKPECEKRGAMGLLWDLTLTFCTAGMWLVWIVIKFFNDKR